jgi:hypothetical protein
MPIGLEVRMKSITISPPTLVFVVATRAALAFGVGMLVAHRIPRSRRTAIARALIAVGALTTIPAALALKRQSRARLVA